MKKDDNELFIKEINEYTINKETYKGSCKTFKVVKVLKDKDAFFPEILILDNGQRITADSIYDLRRSSYDRYRSFDETLSSHHQVFTIEKVSNIRNIFKHIKEEHIMCVKDDITCIKSDINKCEKSLISLNKKLQEKTNCLKLLEGR